MGMGLVATASVAQVTFPVKMGFENADKSDAYHCKFANKVGLSEFGDWVNPQDVDNWIEQSDKEAKSGDYCFMAQNDVEKKNPWDRGFKLGNLPIKEGKSYRMSFWIKGTEGAVMKSYISKGVEQLDKSFVNPAGSAVYGLNGENDYTLTSDDWQHVSFVAFNHGAAPFNSVLANTSWMGGAVVGENVPESLWEGAGINDANKDKTYRDFFNGEIPEIFFSIINLYDGGTFLIDDILIEEDKTFNQATYNNSVIKLDFGYATNIATLAASGKNNCKILDKSQFKVSKDGAEIEIYSVEAHADGFVYIFLNNDAVAEEGVTVSFTPNEDCPLEYGADKRPSNSSEAMKVFGFENEAVYEDASIEAEAHYTTLPQLLSSTPEDESFDLDGNINQFVFVFDAAADVDNSIIKLIDESGKETELTVKASEDNKTLTATYEGGKLKNGKYTISIEVADASGDANFYDITFNVGQTGFDPDSSTELIFNPGFEECANNSVPNVGRFTFGGSVLTPGEGRGSGARLFTDFAQGGQFTAALYSRDWDGDGQYEIGLGDEAIELEEGNYQLSFTWAQWKAGATLKEVQVYKVDEEGEFTGEPIWQNESAYTNSVNVNGGKGAVEGAEEVVAKFNVEEAGRYGVRFFGTGEWLLANVNITYVPEIAGIEHKSALWNAVMEAFNFYSDNDPLDEEHARYDEADFKNLLSLIQKYADLDASAPTDWSKLNMTCPTDYKNAIAEVKAALESAKEFKKVVDEYDALRTEDGIIAQTLAKNAETKFAKLECYAVLNSTYNEYKDKALTDHDELINATNLLKENLNTLRRMSGEALKADGNVDDPWGHVGLVGIPALTARIDLGIATLKSMANEDYTDEEVKAIQEGEESLTDNEAVANELKRLATARYYKAMQNEETAKAFFQEKYTEPAEDSEDIPELISDGTYDMSFFLVNPKLYIVTDRTDANPANSLTAKVEGTEEEPVTIYQGSAFPGWTVSEGTGDWSTGWTNFKGVCTAEAMCSNWGGSFTVSQSIEDLPAGLYVLKAGITERYDDGGSEKPDPESSFFWQTSGDEDRVTMPVPAAGQSWATANVSSARRDAIYTEYGHELVEEGEEPVADAEPIEILDGKLIIGAHAGPNSRIFINNFTISLVGGKKTASMDEFLTGVETVSNKIQNVSVYDMNGRQVVRAAKGVNIVKRTYSDGSVKVGKYIVK